MEEKNENNADMQTCMTFLSMTTLRNKTVAHTFLPSFDNANGRLCQERLLRCRNIATMVTWRHSLPKQFHDTINHKTDPVSRAISKWPMGNRYGCWDLSTSYQGLLVFQYGGDILESEKTLGTRWSAFINFIFQRNAQKRSGWVVRRRQGDFVA